KVDIDDAVEMAKKYERAGAEVIISRGTVGLKIAEVGLSIPVVQIPITGFDLLRTVMEARKYGERIGIADTEDVLQGIKSIESSLECHLEKYTIRSLNEIEMGVKALLDRNVDVLIGKSIYVQQVKDRTVKTVILSTGVESVIQAMNQAKNVLEV